MLLLIEDELFQPLHAALASYECGGSPRSILHDDVVTGCWQSSAVGRHTTTSRSQNRHLLGVLTLLRDAVSWFDSIRAAHCSDMFRWRTPFSRFNCQAWSPASGRGSAIRRSLDAAHLFSGLVVSGPADCRQRCCGGRIHDAHVKSDWHRNNMWPQPFIYADRAAVCLPFAIQVNNGWRMQNTIGDAYFDNATQELTVAGQAKVKWIVQQAPLTGGLCTS